MLQHITNTYYRYQPNEFLPIYSGGEMLNKKEFHLYRIKWIINHYKAFVYQLTHQVG